MKLPIANSIPLNIRIELGHRVMTRQEAKTLQPGQVIALREKHDAPVRVYIDDVYFAAGELVATDDRVSVRITKLIDSPRRKAA